MSAVAVRGDSTRERSSSVRHDTRKARDIYSEGKPRAQPTASPNISNNRKPSAHVRRDHPLPPAPVQHNHIHRHNMHAAAPRSISSTSTSTSTSPQQNVSNKATPTLQNHRNSGLSKQPRAVPKHRLHEPKTLPEDDSHIQTGERREDEADSPPPAVLSLLTVV